MNNQEFIETISTGAKNGQAQFGIFASVTIAQAIIESGWGRYKGNAVQKDHNLFGIKFNGVHAPNIPISKGSYATDDGGYYCHYESWSDSVYDHGYFLRHNKRYTEHGVFSATTPEEQITKIMDSGYASSSYGKNAIEIIKENNLKKYDITTKTNTNNYVYLLQCELNRQGWKDMYGHVLATDGIMGAMTLSALPMVLYGARGNITKIIQRILDVTPDGIFGKNTLRAICHFQANRGLAPDGVVGKNTWRYLLGGLR